MSVRGEGMIKRDRFLAQLEELSSTLARKESIPHQVAQVIQRLITSGELGPGDRIVESRIARQLGVGHPTIREALVALEHQGLVVRQANQGCVVTTLSHKEIAQILRIRAELEVLAVELAAENASEEDAHELASGAREMKVAAQAHDVEEFYRQDLRFHETLWRLCGNPFLAKSLAQLMVPVLAFLMLQNLRKHDYIDMVSSAESHERIAATIISGDKRQAKRVARETLKGFAKQHLQVSGD